MGGGDPVLYRTTDGKAECRGENRLAQPEKDMANLYEVSP